MLKKPVIPIFAFAIAVSLTLLLVSIAPRSQAQSQARMSEEQIRQNVSRVKSDLRTMAVANESYFVDNNTYTDNLRSLTTPIAYIASIPNDPFAPTTATIKFCLPEPGKLAVYSIGPDGKDDFCKIDYDPTNGTISVGDIKRNYDQPFLKINDAALLSKIKAQQAQVDQLLEPVKAWFMAKRTLPPSLDALTTPTAYLRAVPEDLFVKGRRISYHIDDKTGTALIYSFGPDGKDDQGAKLSNAITPGVIPQGDIVSRITLEELRNDFPESTSQTITADFAVPSGNGNKDFTKPILTELLKLKERQGGRDNAMIHYVVASWYSPGVPPNEPMNTVLKKGWSAEAASLIPTINTFQPMFAEIRKGAALNYACNIGFPVGPASPVPNFLTAQIAAKMMCCEGLYRQSQGNYEGAMDDYLTILTMGRDYGTSGTRLIGALISCSTQNIALQQIQNAAASAPLSSALLSKTLAHMKEAEKGKATLAEVLNGEYLSCGVRGLEELRQQLIKDPNARNGNLPPDYTTERFLKNFDNIVAQRRKVQDMQMEIQKVPYWKRDPQKKQELAALLTKVDPIVELGFPNFDEAEVRMLVTQAYLSEAELAVALADYKIQTGKFPEKLADLVHKWFAYLPIDPYGGGEFIYIPNAERSSYQLFSIGPDKQNGVGAIRYDPTNGTFSAGDVIGGRR